MAGSPAEAAGFWRRRLINPLLQQLRQGTAPRELSLAIAAGLTLGLFPILGATMILCGLIGALLRLNQPLIQAVNYLVYPLQLLLLIPFYRAGEWLFSAEPVPILSVSALVERFKLDSGQFFIDYGLVGLYGVVAWLLVAPLLFAATWWIAGPLVSRVASRTRTATASMPEPARRSGSSR